MSKTDNNQPPEATELEYLKWFRINVDFGPGDADVIFFMDEQFEKQTGKRVPKAWVSE